MIGYAHEINADVQEIEIVNEYICVYQTIILGKEKQTAQLTRRIRMTWTTVGKLSVIHKNSDIPIN